MTKNRELTMPLAELLGIELLRADKSRVEASMVVTPEVCTVGEMLHGGAMMAMADCLAAVAAFTHLPDAAAGTTTVESKTNFLRPAPIGAVVTGRTEAIKVGRQISVWSTSLTDDAGRMLAVVTQSQLVLGSPVGVTEVGS